MTLKKEREVIFRAVREAVESGLCSRNHVAREAAIIADRRGVNIQAAPYRQDIFHAALDKKEREGRIS